MIQTSNFFLRHVDLLNLLVCMVLITYMNGKQSVEQWMAFLLIFIFLELCQIERHLRNSKSKGEANEKT